MKKQAYAVDREARAERRSKTRTVTRRRSIGYDPAENAPTQILTKDAVVVTSSERVEMSAVISAMARAFAGTIDFYKAEHGGGLSHAEAVKAAEAMQETRREGIKEWMPAEKVGWGELSALAEVSLPDALAAWARVTDTAVVELESGRRSAGVLGNASAWEVAQFLAIRESFVDEWRPRGGIEAAMIDMLAVAFSLQMYWASIAHQRATRTHDAQEREVRRFETSGWKPPFQSEAEAVEQAHRLADGYNRQFLRVLRQLRDLRRYAPPVIVNNGGQVNVATDGGQQVNVQQTGDS